MQNNMQNMHNNMQNMQNNMHNMHNKMQIIFKICTYPLIVYRICRIICRAKTNGTNMQNMQNNMLSQFQVYIVLTCACSAFLLKICTPHFVDEFAIGAILKTPNHPIAICAQQCRAPGAGLPPCKFRKFRKFRTLRIPGVYY
jgi:hypothetical protein